MAIVFYPTFTKHMAALVSAVALAGCASMAVPPEAIVKARATQHWQARIAGDLDTTYRFTTPSYRGVTPLPKYKGGFGDAVTLISAEVASVQCEAEDRCIVNTKVEVKPNLVLGKRVLANFTTYIDETWLREDGQWWLFPTP